MMDVHIPMWLGYVCGGGAIFVAGMVTMFVIGLLVGRTKKRVDVEMCEIVQLDGEQDG